MKKHEPIPPSHPVQPLKDGENPKGKATCGHCGLSWDDSIPTSLTPAPSARCPFEYFHVYTEVESGDLKVHNCRFVNVTDIFDGHEKLKKIFDEGDGYDFSWGDNNHSLIEPSDLINALEDKDGVGYEPEEGEEVEEGIVTKDEWDSFCERLNNLPHDVYIDLEN